MTPDDMARELRAAGWDLTAGGNWMLLTDNSVRVIPGIERAHRAMQKELAQQRAQGTVTTPVVGQEEK